MHTTENDVELNPWLLSIMTICTGKEEVRPLLAHHIESKVCNVLLFNISMIDLCSNILYRLFFPQNSLSCTLYC